MARATKNILVVEDNPMIAMDLDDMLTSAGHVVIGPVATVEEAIDLIDTYPVDCASLDFNLGDVNVTPVAVRLAAENVPFIFVTGNVSLMRDHPPFPKAPVVHKPFEFHQLEAALGL